MDISTGQSYVKRRGDVHAHRESGKTPDNIVRLYCSNRLSHGTSYMHEGTHYSGIAGCHSHMLDPRDADKSKMQSLDTSLLQSIQVTICKSPENPIDNRLSEDGLVAINEQLSQMPEFVGRDGVRHELISFREKCITVKQSPVYISNLTSHQKNLKEPEWNQGPTSPFTTIESMEIPREPLRLRSSKKIPAEVPENDIKFVIVTEELRELSHKVAVQGNFPKNVYPNLKDNFRPQFDSSKILAHSKSKSKMPVEREQTISRSATSDKIEIYREDQGEEEVEYLSDQHESPKNVVFQDFDRSPNSSGEQIKIDHCSSQHQRSPLKSSFKKSRHNQSEGRLEVSLNGSKFDPSPQQSRFDASPHHSVMSIHQNEYQIITPARQGQSVQFMPIENIKTESSEIYSRIAKYGDAKVPRKTEVSQTEINQSRQNTSRFGTEAGHSIHKCQPSRDLIYNQWKNNSHSNSRDLNRLITDISSVKETPLRHQLLASKPDASSKTQTKKSQPKVPQPQTGSYYLNPRHGYHTGTTPSDYYRCETASKHILEGFGGSKARPGPHRRLASNLNSSASNLNMSYYRHLREKSILTVSGVSNARSKHHDIVSMNLQTGQKTRNMMRDTLNL